jgi:myo-inositol catabolism protein IolC
MRKSSRTSGRSNGASDARIAGRSSPPARRNGRDEVGCIVLGRGEDAKQVRDWLTVAAGVGRFIGFAVGRTVFWGPLVAWLAKKTTREAAVAEVARRYKQFVDVSMKGELR